MSFIPPKIKLNNSLYFKISLWYVTSIGLAVILFGFFLYFYTAGYISQELDEKLAADTEIISLPLSEMWQATMQLPVLERTAELRKEFNAWVRKKNREAGFFNKFIVLSDVSGQILASSKSLSDPKVFKTQIAKNISPGRYAYSSFRKKSGFSMRIITYPFYDDGQLRFYLQVGVSAIKEDEFLSLLRLLLLLLFPAVIILLVLGIFFLRRLLRPLYTIVSHMQAVDADILGNTLPDIKASDELRILIDNYNQMLARLHKSFEKLKELGVDISHQMRTPLTILQGEIEVALSRERSLQEYQEVLKSNLEEVKKMVIGIEKLLFLGRLKSNTYLGSEEIVSLTSLVSQVFSRFKLLMDKKGLCYFIEAPSDIKVNADPFLLENLLMNLFDNAVKYSCPSSRVLVVLRKQDDGIFFQVVNSVDKDKKIRLDRIFDRYYRADVSSGHGGVGLTIAEEIAKSYGGKISASIEEDKVIFGIYIPLSPLS